MQLVPNKRAIARVAGPSNNDGLAKGMEFVFGLLLFAGVGWLIDRALDTKPWFTIGLFVLGVIGHFARIWYAYEADMQRHEADLTERRTANGARAQDAAR